MHNKNGTVGRFLPNIQYKVVPVNGIREGGRLFIYGPNVMQGYIHVNKPGVILPLDDGWYNTGDIVSVDHEGYLIIQGRVKRFAKIAGEMVSLTAIENHIANLWPHHLHATVSVPDDKKGEIVVLVTDNSCANKEAIIGYFKKNDIAELYMPKQIFIVEEMFILGSGKVNISQVQKYVEQHLSHSHSQAEEKSQV
jgi:acyl-[acyl-carrier-protein]-phospholipid O-acyltransferase/long-chain-fatty-acid--[acyl-carrier-protein] ligase